MTIVLASKPGITGTSTLSIPKAWDPNWFRDFINNQLKGADVRNAVGANGITISGNITSPYATIGIQGTSQGLIIPVQNNTWGMILQLPAGSVNPGGTTYAIWNGNSPVGWFGNASFSFVSGSPGPAFPGVSFGDVGIAVDNPSGQILLGYGGGGATVGYAINFGGPSANFQAAQANITNFIGSCDTSTGTGLLWLQAGGGSDSYGGAVAMYGGSNTINTSTLGSGGGVWIGMANHGTGVISFGLGGNPQSVDATYVIINRGGALLVNGASQAPTGTTHRMALTAVGLSTEYGLVINMSSGVTVSSTHYVTFGESGTQAGAITAGATATSVLYSTGSDYRLKTNVQTLPSSVGMAMISKLRPISFNWIGDGYADIGFLANEVQAVVPQAVSGVYNAVNPDGSILPQGLDLSKLVPWIVAALQAHDATIQAQAAQIATYQTQIAALQTQVTAITPVTPAPTT